VTTKAPGLLEGITFCDHKIDLLLGLTGVIFFRNMVEASPGVARSLLYVQYVKKFSKKNS
jgi:hypothetical protein